MALEGWLLVLSVLVSGVCLGFAVLIVQLSIEAWQAWQSDRRRKQQVTEDALRYVEQRQLQQRIRTLVDEEQRRRLDSAARTGRPS
jgi:hypothetical protein